jgi:hypothetical protein
MEGKNNLKREGKVAPGLKPAGTGFAGMMEPRILQEAHGGKNLLRRRGACSRGSILKTLNHG